MMMLKKKKKRKRGSYQLGDFGRQQKWMNELFMEMCCEQQEIFQRACDARQCYFFFLLITFWIELNFTWCSDDRINIGPTVKGYAYFWLIFYGTIFFCLYIHFIFCLNGLQWKRHYGNMFHAYTNMILSVSAIRARREEGGKKMLTGKWVMMSILKIISFISFFPSFALNN